MQTDTRPVWHRYEFESHLVPRLFELTTRGRGHDNVHTLLTETWEQPNNTVLDTRDIASQRRRKNSQSAISHRYHFHP